MLNNFIYAKTKDLFLEPLEAGHVLDEAVVFIEDTKEIWNHGTYFDGTNVREYAFPKTGGLITGVSSYPLQLKSSSDIYSTIRFITNNNDYITFGFKNSDNPQLFFTNKNSWDKEYFLYHSGNLFTGTSSQFLKADGSVDSTAYLSTTGGNINGNLVIDGILNILGDEFNTIRTAQNPNSSITNMPNNLVAIKHAIGFKWYDTEWQIGNIRGGGQSSVGFGITKNNDTCVFRVSESGAKVNENTVLHAGNYSDYALPLSGGTINKSLEVKQHLDVLGRIREYGLMEFNHTDGSVVYLANNKYTGSGDGKGLAVYTGDTWCDVIHSGNIGSYRAGDSVLLAGMSPTSYLGFGDQLTSNVDANELRGMTFHVNATGNGSGNTNMPIGYGYLLNLCDSADSDAIYYKGVQISFGSGDVLQFRRHWGHAWQPWKTIAFTDSNVASATKLATARTIWGQSFDGTADVSGSLTIYKNSSDYTAGWARSIHVRNSADTILSMFGFYGEGDALEYTYIGTSYDSPLVSIQPSGNVGIGVKYSTFKLDVAGTVKATQYKSVYSSTQWTFGGGVLTDTDTDFALTNSTTYQPYIVAKSNPLYVGIGVKNPAYTLEVGGTGRFSGAVTMASTLSVDDDATINGNLHVTGNTILDGDNNLEVVGKQYLQDVGGYDGTNPTESYDLARIINENTGANLSKLVNPYWLEQNFLEHPVDPHYRIPVVFYYTPDGVSALDSEVKPLEIWRCNRTLSLSEAPIYVKMMNTGVVTGTSYAYVPASLVNNNGFYLTWEDTVNRYELFINDTNTTPNITLKCGATMPITYSELVDLRDSSKLIPGQQYRITDYCTVFTPTTLSANHPFDIIVTADSSNTINERAKAVLHEGDTYFSNQNLEAWEIWYSLDWREGMFLDYSSGGGVYFRIYGDYRIIRLEFNDNIEIDGVIYYQQKEFASDVYYENNNKMLYRILINSAFEITTINKTTGEIDNGYVVNPNITKTYNGELYYSVGDDLWVKSNYDIGDRIIYFDIQELYDFVLLGNLSHKGVIYRMIDEYGNDIPYDFKNVLGMGGSIEYADSNFLFTFSDASRNDWSMSGKCFNNKWYKNYFKDPADTILFKLEGSQYWDTKVCCDNTLYCDGACTVWNNDDIKNITIDAGCRNICLDTRRRNVHILRGVIGDSIYNPIFSNAYNLPNDSDNYEIKIAKNSAGEIKGYCEADLIA